MTSHASGFLPLLRSPTGWKAALVFALTLTAALSAWALLPEGMRIPATLVVFCVSLWATSLIAEYWPALAFFVVAMIAKIAPPEVVFSGFQSSPFWLLFGGMVLGASIRHTGLGKRIALMLHQVLGNGYQGMVAGIVVFGIALAFVLPSSMGRVVLLLPIVAALADQVGFKDGSNGKTGMLIAATFGTFLPGFSILPANAPNMVLAGMTETILNTQLGYWDYLILNFPILGSLKGAVLIGLVLKLFPDQLPQQINDSDYAPTIRLTFSEKHLMLVLLSCLGLWLTDSIHHISPGWIGLAAALYCLMPVSRLTSPKCLNEDIQYGALFFAAGIMGVGALISHIGMGHLFVGGMETVAGFSTETPVWNLFGLTLMSSITGALTNLPGIPVLITPMAEHLAELTGLSITAVLMTQVAAFANVFLPYQAPPLVLAIQVGKLPIATVSRVCLYLFAIGWLVLIPLDFLWWWALGLI
ncbi:MAG: sodium:sulfate symporter [Oceanospirillaceae bacterium]|nr:sodium:sulfate symporter [Oceanospirillaceae bacterium]